MLVPRSAWNEDQNALRSLDAERRKMAFHAERGTR